jgi:hypothetical protein
MSLYNIYNCFSICGIANKESDIIYPLTKEQNLFNSYKHLNWVRYLIWEKLNQWNFAKCSFNLLDFTCGTICNAKANDNPDSDENVVDEIGNGPTWWVFDFKNPEAEKMQENDNKKSKVGHNCMKNPIIVWRKYGKYGYDMRIFTSDAEPVHDLCCF